MAENLKQSGKEKYYVKMNKSDLKFYGSIYC